ncbi:NB-ARC domain-containing protein [Nonomuraea sp. NPDC048882]|uniref:NB-ARC domain-containing protein n=1 Tax=Nonomuraea sp. NPDC048882 TaxID=3154347 RepID=UPI0033F13393
MFLDYVQQARRAVGSPSPQWLSEHEGGPKSTLEQIVYARRRRLPDWDQMESLLKALRRRAQVDGRDPDVVLGMMAAWRRAHGDVERHRPPSCPLPVAEPAAAAAEDGRLGRLIGEVDPIALFWVPAATGTEIDRAELTGQMSRLVTTPSVVGLHGGAGVGKSTLARLVCRRPEIKDHFRDGIVWVDVGVDCTPARMTELISGVVRRLGSTEFLPSDPMQAGMRLGELIADRRLLIVVDDVWEERQLTPLLQGGSRCTRLVTTRDRRLLPGGVPIMAIDVMTGAEAADLIRATVPSLDAPAAARLAELCGRWPILLGLLGGYLRTRIADGVAVDTAYDEVLGGLTEQGAAAFDEEAVSATVELSLRLLADAGQLDHYLDLAVFPRGTDIPRRALEVLWRAHGWTPWQVQRFCAKLADLGLAKATVSAEPGVRLHDVLHQYLIRRAGVEMPRLHAQLVDAYRDVATPWWTLPPEDAYIWRELFGHLRGAGLADELAALAHDLRWTVNKVRNFGAAAAEVDLLTLPNDPHSVALARLLRQTGHLHLRGDSHTLTAGTIAVYTGGTGVLAASAYRLDWPLLWPVRSMMPDQPSASLVRTLTAKGTVHAVTTAPDGSWVAAADENGYVSIWAMSDGALRHRMSMPADWTHLLVADATGSLIASTGDDQIITVHDVESGEVVAELTGHPWYATALAAAPDFSWIAFAGFDRAIILWDFEARAPRFWLGGHTSVITALAAAPDGSWLASASADGTVQLWDLSEPRLRSTIGHPAAVTALAVDPHGGWIASASNDGTVRLSDPTTGETMRNLRGYAYARQLCRRLHPTRALAVAPDGSWLAATAEENAVRIWDTGSGDERFVLPCGDGPVRSLAVDPQGSWLAAASDDTAIHVWNTADGSAIAELRGHTRAADSLAAVADGSHLVSGSPDGTVRIWNTRAGEPQREPFGDPWISAIVHEPGLTWYAYATRFGRLGIMDTGHGTVVRRWQGHDRPVSALVPVAGGRWLASASKDGTVRVWNADTGTIEVELPDHEGPVNTLAVDPAGSWLASAGEDGTVRVWDVATWTERHRFHHESAGENAMYYSGDTRHLFDHHRSVHVLATAPDGSWLASGGEDRTIRIWNPATGEPGPTMTGHDGPVKVLRVYPGGSRLASAAKSRGPVRIWNPATGAATVTVTGDRYGDALLVGRDGEWIAFAAYRGQIEISGRRTALLSGHTAQVTDLAVAPDGALLASTSYDDTLRLWDLAAATEVAAMRVDGMILTCRWLSETTVVAGGASGLYHVELRGPAVNRTG